MVAKLVNYSELNIKWTNIFEIKKVGLYLYQKKNRCFYLLVRVCFLKVFLARMMGNVYLCFE